MKAARYFPLAYLANVHGFILLAPYLVLCLTILRTVQVYRKLNPADVGLTPASV